MKTRSAKAKGRRLQNLVREKIITSLIYGPIIRTTRRGETLQEEDIKVAVMGETGTDIKLSPLGKTIIPFDIECKNVESLNIWQALKQAEANSTEGRVPLVVFTRNRSDVYCALKFDDLLRLL